ncbi:MAG: DegV family protein [Polyangia bacterium]
MSPLELMREALIAGAADLSRRSALLDRINVFPVVDADTGANMTRTVEAMSAAIRDGRDVSRAVLLGARGNSGVILAQFLVGLLDHPSIEELDPRILREAVGRGRELARRAVAEPVEGTMLTAMDDLERLLGELAPIESRAEHLRLENELAAAVARTPELLPRLAEAGVVDSGALGFHLLACGLTLALPALLDPGEGLRQIRARRDGEHSAPLGGIADRIDPGFLAEATRESSGLRWCMDVVVETASEPPPGWERRFADLGASLDSVRRGELLKLHVHCNDRDAVRAAAERLGRVISFGADDMSAGLVRARAIGREPASGAGLRVLGDSSMSFDDGLAAELGVSRLENYVTVHARTLRDGELDHDELLARMREGAVYTTAQAPPQEVRAWLDRELAEPGHAIYFAVGGAYTGTQALVRSVAAEHPLSERLTILNTRAASGQQGLAALATALRAREEQDPRALEEYARRQIASCREYLVLDTLRYLSRTGRVGRVKAGLAGALSFKPIVGHGDHGAITWGVARSHESALGQIAGKAGSHPGRGRLLVLLERTDDRRRLERARDVLGSELPADTLFFEAPLSSTSSVHMGPGTWGVAVTRQWTSGPNGLR